MSSTAIVLQTLSEKGLLKTAGGQSSFAVLLFQDIAVIPMLGVFPLLAARRGRTVAAMRGARRDDAGVRPAGLGADAGGARRRRPRSWLAGASSCGRCFRAIARTRLREIFTAAALLLVVGIALLMTAVGLSPGARHLPRRRRARRQRVPPRARERHRAVQGPAARPVLHRRRRVDRLRAHRWRSRCSIAGPGRWRSSR